MYDLTDQLCTECGIGLYKETSHYDDLDGVLHCTNKKCNHEVKRYKWEHNPQPHKQLTNKQMSYSEKYQQLENQIEELQKEVKRLKEEEVNNKLPKNFAIDVVKKILDDGDTNYLDYAFDWTDTKQGEDYWYEICGNLQPLRKKDIIQLQKWVIMYLEQNQK